MEKQKFVYISQSIASAILERERVYPVFLMRNVDNSFMATFIEAVEDLLLKRLADVDPNILIFEPPDGHLLSIGFGFTDQPKY